MLLNVYEFEKRNQNVYDDVRIYCKLEKVNEEHFRSLFEKPNSFREWLYAYTNKALSLSKECHIQRKLTRKVQNIFSEVGEINGMTDFKG